MDVCVSFKVMKLWTSPYHPKIQWNGFNRTLNAVTSHFVNAKQDNWDQFIPLRSYAYNATFNATTGHSLYYLMMSRSKMSLAEVFASFPKPEGTTWEKRRKLPFRKHDKQLIRMSFVVKTKLHKKLRWRTPRSTSFLTKNQRRSLDPVLYSSDGFASEVLPPLYRPVSGHLSQRPAFVYFNST